MTDDHGSKRNRVTLEELQAKADERRGMDSSQVAESARKHSLGRGGPEELKFKSFEMRSQTHPPAVGGTRPAFQEVEAISNFSGEFDDVMKEVADQHDKDRRWMRAGVILSGVAAIAAVAGLIVAIIAL